MPISTKLSNEYHIHTGMSDSNFPNARSYGQILPFFNDDSHDDEGPLSEIMELFTNLLNNLGGSEEVIKLTLEISYLAKKTPPIISILPGMPQAIQLILVEATVFDDTDESSMNVFRDIMETTEQAKRRRFSRLTLVDMVMKHVSSTIYKDGRKRMPFSVINKTSVRGSPIVMDRTEMNRLHKLPHPRAGRYLKSEAQIPVDFVLNDGNEAVTDGGKDGIMSIYKSRAKRLVQRAVNKAGTASISDPKMRIRNSSPLQSSLSSSTVLVRVTVMPSSW